MDDDLARKLFYEGATLIVLDMPQGSEFGIDYNSWTVGPNFKGVKMIPPGFHFVFYSAVSKVRETAPRTGFLYFFKQKEIIVRRWDKSLEIISSDPISSNDGESMREKLVELDSSLGAYPYESLKKWVSLSNYITEDILLRVQAPNGYVSSVTQVLPDGPKRLSEQSMYESEGKVKTQSTEWFAGVGYFSSQWKKSLGRHDTSSCCGNLQARPDAALRFHLVSRAMFPTDATPAQVSYHCMDFSYSLEVMLKEKFESENELLGELQLAFLCFLQGQVYDAFEHWKSLVHLLCSCEEAMKNRPSLFSEFLKEVPEDFFVDIISQNNFLAETLQTFFSILEDSKGSIDSCLVKKGLNFRDSVSKQFKWDFSLVSEEYAPTLVDKV